MFRRLHIRYMIVGPGGYEERRLEIPLPSFLTALSFALLIIGLWSVWSLRHG